MFERFELLVGKEKINLLSEKKVLVLGLGGVGGYVVESLARSGIGTLILVDYDIVDITNKNRQLIALDDTIGKKKTEVWEERLKKINPKINIVLLDEKIKEESVSKLLSYEPDFIVDACDTIAVKKELIRTCLSRNIPFISSMGTGNKLDPTKLKITDLRKTSYDPIAKILRKMVRDEKIHGKIPVLCSTEMPLKTKEKVGSTSFVPGISGLLLSSYVIRYFIKENL